MKRLMCILWVPLTFIPAYLPAQQFEQPVQDVIDAIELDSLLQYVNVLSGELETDIDGTPYTITSRNKNFDGNEKAAVYIRQKLESYGLNVYEQTFTPLGKNVFAVQLGEEHPDQIYMICAHYDNMPPFATAPGADDNATGVAAVIEAARIFSQYSSGHTIIYGLWDNEEYGLLGSTHYAWEAFKNNEDILGVINLDMIGWDSNGDSKVDIHTDIYADSYELAYQMTEINELYDIETLPSVYYPGTYNSDHAAFWGQGYTAILLIEAYWGGDFNAYYHSVDDKVDKLDTEFFHKCAKLGLGTLASLVGLNDAVTVVESKSPNLDFGLLENYPNPFNPSTTIVFRLFRTSKVKIAIYDAMGKRVRVLVDDQRGAGQYEVIWDGTDFQGKILGSGLYFYHMQTPTYQRARRMILLR